MSRHVVVIGAGLGGLATAIRLQRAGWQVTVIEKNDRIGGRCNVIEEAGYSFDTGPTLLLMRDVFEELFASVGEELSNYLDLVRVHPNYRVRFGDGTSIELSQDFDRVDHQLETIEPGAGLAFRRYLQDAGYHYRIARERFVERNFLHWYDFFTPANLYYVSTTHTLRKLNRHAARFFRDPRLVDAFTFQTMYLGLAPRDAPAVYSLLPYTELMQGIWYPRGGMYRIVEAMAQLAGRLGVQLETGVEVTRLLVRKRRVVGVERADGEQVPADVVVCNADLVYAYERLLPAASRGRVTSWRLERLAHGSSAFLMYLGVDRRYPELDHHNVFLSSDTSENFSAIFDRGELPHDPSFYVCAPLRSDTSLAPPGHDALYVLVPVPAVTPAIDWSQAAAPFRDQIYRRLEAIGLQDVRRHVTFERIYTPRDFVADYNIARGSAFGIAHNFAQVGYMRPANKAAAFDNLYFVGASTVPGGGMPMVIIGSRLTTERVLRDWGYGGEGATRAA